MSDSAWQVLLVLTSIGVVAEGLVLVGVLRQVGTLLVGPAQHGQVEGGPPQGEQVEVSGLRPQTPAIIVFMSPECKVCPPVAAAFPKLRRSYPRVNLVAAVMGEHEDIKKKYASRLRGAKARLDLDHLFRYWQIPGTPYAVGVDREHRVVTSGIVNNLPQLENIAELVVHVEDDTTDAESATPESEGTNGELPPLELRPLDVSRS